MEQKFGNYPLNKKGLRHLQREADAIKRKIQREFCFPPETSGLNEEQIQKLEDQIDASPFESDIKQQMLDCVSRFGLLDKETQIQLFKLTNSMDYVDKPRQHAYIASKYPEIEQEKRAERKRIKGKHEPFDLASYNDEIQRKTQKISELDQDDKKNINAIINEGTIYGYPKLLLSEKIRHESSLSPQEKKELMEKISPVSEKIRQTQGLDSEAKKWLLQKMQELSVDYNTMYQFKTQIQEFMQSDSWKDRIATILHCNIIPEAEKEQITQKINIITEKTMQEYAFSILLQCKIKDKFGEDKILLIDSLNHTLLKQYMSEAVEVTPQFKAEDGYELSSGMIKKVVGMARYILPDLMVFVNPQVGVQRIAKHQKVEAIEQYQKQIIKPKFAERYRKGIPPIYSER